MNRFRRWGFILCFLGIMVFFSAAGAAEKPILVGFPMFLTGGGALFG